MPSAAGRRIAAITLGLGLLFAGTFATFVVFYGRELGDDIRRKMIERDAAVLHPVVQQHVAPSASLHALLPDAHREGMLALALFDATGITIAHIPANQPLVELPLDDFVRLQDGHPISRFHPTFPLATLLPDASTSQTSPVLEIVLPLRRPTDAAHKLLGFVRYHLDARPLAAELAALDDNVRRKTLQVLALGVACIGLIMSAGHLALTRTQRALAERNDRLTRTHFELSLAAKASALGQITSNLIHDLKGPVSSLQAVVHTDQAAAAAYADRLQTLIRETTDLLSDHSAHATYELTAAELAEIIRRRNAALADEQGVAFHVAAQLSQPLDSHRAGLLCLIINNLVQNALAATPRGRAVTVDLSADSDTLTAIVADEGHGISEDLLPHLFTPGRSGRANGTGLGLAISQLLARQIGATLELASTSPAGTTFRLILPMQR